MTSGWLPGLLGVWTSSGEDAGRPAGTLPAGTLPGDPNCPPDIRPSGLARPGPGGPAGHSEDLAGKPDPGTHHHQQEGLGEGEGGEPTDEDAEPRGHAAGLQR